MPRFEKAYFAVSPSGYPFSQLKRGFEDALDSLETQTGPVAGKRFFDAGCAKGYLVKIARRRGAIASGGDKSKYAVSEARKFTPEAEFFLADFNSGRLPQTGLDVITSYHVIEHLENGPAFLRAAREALKEGGVLHLMTPNRMHDPKIDGTHVTSYNAQTIRKELETAGFKRIIVRYRPAPKRILSWTSFVLRKFVSLPSLGIGSQKTEKTRRKSNAQKIKERLTDPKAAIEVFAFK